MTDDRLRELERRYRESGAAEHEAAYLREASRRGVISERNLGIAADAGYPPARQALELEPLEVAEVERLGKLIRERWGQWSLVRLSRALVPHMLPEEELASAQRLALNAMLEAVDAWVATPESGPAYAVHRALPPLQELVDWAGEDVAVAVQDLGVAVSRPPNRGSFTTRGCDVPRYFVNLRGLDAYLRVVAADFVPRMLRPEA